MSDVEWGDRALGMRNAKCKCKCKIIITRRKQPLSDRMHAHAHRVERVQDVEGLACIAVSHRLCLLGFVICAVTATRWIGLVCLSDGQCADALRLYICQQDVDCSADVVAVLDGDA